MQLSIPIRNIERKHKEPHHLNKDYLASITNLVYKYANSFVSNSVIMNKAIILLIISITGLVGCASLKKANEIQNEYAKSFEKTTAEPITFQITMKVDMTRGAIPTYFSATLPQGVYYPIASSDGRNFYQAPEGFKYEMDYITQSEIGGVVQINKDDLSRFYVWYFSSEYNDDYTQYFDVEINGDWISDVKPGFMNVEGRPWIEHELIILK